MSKPREPRTRQEVLAVAFWLSTNYLGSFTMPKGFSFKQGGIVGEMHKGEYIINL